jgi:hypothetical protein
MSTYENDYLLLKWGTLKGWSFKDPECVELLRLYHEDPTMMSVMAQKDTDRQKEILLQLIDKCKGRITNDWDGEDYTKEQARNYILNYGKKEPAVL